MNKKEWHYTVISMSGKIIKSMEIRVLLIWIRDSGFWALISSTDFRILKSFFSFLFIDFEDAFNCGFDQIEEDFPTYTRGQT